MKTINIKVPRGWHELALVIRFNLLKLKTNSKKAIGSEKYRYFSCINVIYKLHLQRESQRSHNILSIAAQNQKVRDKIIKILSIIETIERVPVQYLKYIEGTNGLFEVRVQLGSNIFRIFCFFDGNKFVVLLSGFQKKTQKTPSGEIEKAERLMKEYFESKDAK